MHRTPVDWAGNYRTYDHITVIMTTAAKPAEKMSPTGSSTHISDEKYHVEADEKLKVPTYQADVDTGEIDEKKLIRKLDWALIPWLSFLYLLSFLDRTSIGNAKVSIPQTLPRQDPNQFHSVFNLSCTTSKPIFISTTPSTGYVSPSSSFLTPYLR